MSHSKFIMAKKLHNVQKRLMGNTINEDTLDCLLSLIFKECSKEKLTFWFNFLENEIVLNLRDIEHENYELNIRQHYTETAKTDDLKKMVLVNTFLITKNSVEFESLNEASSQKKSDETHIISGDKPVPPHIREAIEKIQAKGIPVTPETIQNHLPTAKMSTNATIQCNNYLKKMKEASQ